MLTRKDHRNATALNLTLVAAAVSAALSLTAFTGGALADTATPASTANDQVASDYCTAALPALQRAAGGEQSGHLQALKILKTCDTRLGQIAAANFAGWQIDRALDRADPHDE